MAYLDYSADVIGAVSVVDAKAKQVNEDTAGRCTYFDDLFELISKDASKLSSELNALRNELEALNQKIERLMQDRDKKKREILNKYADISSLRYRAGREDAVPAFEKLLMARAYHRLVYELDDWLDLYCFGAPKDVRELLGQERSQTLYMLTRKTKTRIEPYLTTDEHGVQKLAGYPKQSNGFPIKAYQVACCRAGLDLDNPVFTFREKWPLEVIEQTYDNLPSTQALKEAKREAQGVRELTWADKFKIVGEVRRDMPRKTDKAQAIEIKARFEKVGLPSSESTAIRALRAFKKKYGIGKSCTVMLS